MSSLCIKLHEAQRLALPAAKQKEEEEMETFWWEPDASALWTLCEPEHTAQRSSWALSWRCHWYVWTKNIPKTMFSPQLPENC